MSKRVELLNRVDGCEMSLFLLCNLLGRRTRQVANGRGVPVSSQLVNETLKEFLEGKLKYELEERGRHLPPSSIATTTVDNERHPSNGAIRERGGRRLLSVQEVPDSALAGLRRG